MFAYILYFLLGAISCLFLYSKYKHNYWKSFGVKSPPGYPIVGHILSLIFGSSWDFINDCYTSHKKDGVYGAYEFFTPCLYILKPEMVRKVMVKDFDSFSYRRDFSSDNQTLNEMLSTINGDSWKKLRHTMSPTFSSGKMKQIYMVIQKEAKNFVIHCNNKIKTETNLDIRKSFGLYTMDVIGSAAFGISVNSLLKNEESLFAKHGDGIFKPTLIENLKFIFLFLVPSVGKLLGLSFTNESWRFFEKVSKETTEERRRSKIHRGDFLDLLLGVQESQKESFDETKEYKVTDSTILSESVLFLIAGYETTANTMTTASFLLAKYPECQKKLREELNTIQKDGDIDYLDLMEAKYLEGCISEALRLYPPAPILERKCVKEYQLEEAGLTIPKDMMVQVPAWGLHHDPEYWPDPYVFKPERFYPENKSSIVPFTYLPFGVGPRNCIAMRFALMEAKACIAALVMNFEISLAPGHEELKLINNNGGIRPSALLELKQIQSE